MDSEKLYPILRQFSLFCKILEEFSSFLKTFVPKVFTDQFTNLPGVEKSATKYHNCFARRLFQLHLNARELFVNYLDHSFDFLGRDRSGATLLSQQVHHVGREFIASLHFNIKKVSQFRPSNSRQVLRAYEFFSNKKGGTCATNGEGKKFRNVAW